jgi:WD40 repeat protein
MAHRRHAFLLLLLALFPLSGPLPAQPPALPEGARLRLGNSGLIGPFSAAALSPHGKYLAVSDKDGHCTLRELPSGKEIVRWPLPKEANPPLLGFSPDGQTLVFGNSQSLSVAELPGGKLLRSFQLHKDGPRPHYTLVFAAGGKYVTLSAPLIEDDKAEPVHVWELATGKALGPFGARPLHSVRTALSPDGRILALVHDGGRSPAEEPRSAQVQLWDVATAQELRQLEVGGPRAEIVALAFAPDGKTLAIANGRSTFHLFDIATGKERRRFAGPNAALVQLTFSPDGLLLAGADDGLIQAWRLSDGQRRDLPAGPQARLLSLAFPAAGQVRALGAQGAHLIGWDVLTGQAEYFPAGHRATIRALSFAPRGRQLTSISDDGQLCRWDAAIGNMLDQFALTSSDGDGKRPLPGSYEALALSPDARFAAINVLDSYERVRLWDLRTRRAVCEFDAEWPATSLRLTFAATGARLASFGHGRGVNQWDIVTGQELPRLPLNHSDRALSLLRGQYLALSPDGSRLALARGLGKGKKRSYGVEIAWYDTADGREQTLASILFPRNSPLHTAFSPDGKLLAIAGELDTEEHLTQLLRTANGQEYRRLATTLAGATATALAFAPNGRTLAAAYASAGAPATVEIWEVASGGRRCQLRADPGALHALAFSADGSTLAAGGDGTSILLWDISGRPKAAAALTGPELDEAWAALADQDAPKAYTAMGRLLGDPEAALALIGRQLPPGPAAAGLQAKLGKWLPQLDSDSFALRDEAFRGLEQLGSAAEPALRRARAARVSLEVRRRLDDLLGRLERTFPTPAELQICRAIEVLELLGTPAAYALLASLAQGAEGALQVREARQVLARLAP